MGAQYNDGAVQYGTRTLDVVTSLTTTTAIGTYIADNISVNRPTKRIERTNNLGEPTGSAGVAGFVTGTATIQFANASAVEVAAGNVFTINFGTTTGTETFIIESPGLAENKDGEKKQSISFVKKYST